VSRAETWPASERAVASNPILPAYKARKLRDAAATHADDATALASSIDAAIAYLEWQAHIGAVRNQVLIDVLRRMTGPATRVLMGAEHIARLSERGKSRMKPAPVGVTAGRKGKGK